MVSEQDATTRDSSVAQWIRELSESKGSPGGGAASGLMLAIAASLTSMVAGYTESEDDHEHLDAIRARAQALRATALDLADEDATASRAFGAAFRLQPGERRAAAIQEASIAAAEASARLGDQAVGAVADLSWLAGNGNPALISDVIVGLGALRAALTGARTNVSFDLASANSPGRPLTRIRQEQPTLWESVEALDAAIAQIDRVVATTDDRAAPTDHADHS